MVEKEIIYIAPTEKIESYKKKQLRVGIYARVSTESEEQASSYESQIKYYRDKVNENENWKLVGVYGEEISGTRAEKRPEFMKMIGHCRKKKIDLIITKSISRFARNTVDSLKYIRELKAIGIGIIFEKENINTLDSKSEVIITILSSLAQEESNSISANVKMGKRMAMKEGKVDFNVNIYGYEVNKNKIEIIKDEAKIIKMIFKEYLAGKSIKEIQKLLKEQNIKSPKGNETWGISTLQRIIENEKYVGDVIMQKSYVTDPISKKVKKNNGELPKVLVKNNHPSIIDRELFEMVQIEKSRRNSKRKISEKTKTEQGKFSSKYALSEILVCGDCKTPYRRTTWARNGNKKVVWRCINRLENGTKYCKTSPTLDEEMLHFSIIEALNITRERRKELAEYLIKYIKKELDENDDGNSEIQKIEDKIQGLKELTMELIGESIENPEQELTERLSKINEEIRHLKETGRQIEKIIGDKRSDEVKIGYIVKMLSEQKGHIKKYDDSIIRQSISRIDVIDERRITITFKDRYTYEQRIVESDKMAS